MKNPPRRHRLVPSTAAAAAALGAAAWLLTPAEPALAFSTLGGSLSAETQRDFRIHDNFSDPTANNNTTPDPSFPGWLGVEMAMWKGAMEWGSGPHGDGTGDPVHTNIGDGGANFDFYWAGNASGVGGSNDNIASQIASCSGGTLAFVEIPIGNGWRMRFCDSAGAWSDGPGAPTQGEGGIDLQGVATHEFGHALGLGHSSIGTAVMAPTTANGMSQRNLHPDDQAGVQFVYGVKSASKPVITSAFVDVDAGTARIQGANFSATNNEVRFTNAGSTSTGSDPHLRVTGVSSSNGGTEILVSIPSGAFSGDVLVKQDASGHATLSNPWPVDLVDGGSSGGDPDARFTAFPTSGSTPLTVAFTDESTGTGIDTWAWEFGDGGTSTQASPSYTYMQPGTYDVMLTVVGSNGMDFVTREDLVVVTQGAGCADRQGSGVNPDVFTCANDPVLGSTWIASVDGQSVGATGLSVLVGFPAPLPSPLLTGFGELLVDPTAGAVVSDTAPTVNGAAIHVLAVPNDASLEGFVVYSQAFLGGVGVLTNGLDLTLGT